MATKSQDLILREATLGGWQRQGIHSALGQIRRDYFGRSRRLVEVRYDGNGRVTEALLRTTSLAKGTPRILKHLTSRDSDKTASIVSWLQTR